MGLRPVQTEPPAPLLTQTKSIVGTPAYMAPEMLLVGCSVSSHCQRTVMSGEISSSIDFIYVWGPLPKPPSEFYVLRTLISSDVTFLTLHTQAQPYDFAVDWWALGVLFFTMLKGRLPFDAAEEDKMLWRIVKSKPRYDPGWRKDTLEVLRALLQKRPATRLCTLRDVGNMTLYKDYDWAKLEKCELPPPFVPRLRNDEDRTYVPRRVATQEVPEKPLAYTKGDSMRKLFRKFSHRSTVSRASTDDN